MASSHAARSRAAVSGRRRSVRGAVLRRDFAAAALLGSLLTDAATAGSGVAAVGSGAVTVGRRCDFGFRSHRQVRAGRREAGGRVWAPAVESIPSTAEAVSFLGMVFSSILPALDPPGS